MVLDGSYSACRENVLTLERLATIPHVVVSSGNDETGFIDDALSECGLQRDIVVRVPLVSLVRMPLARIG